MKMRRRRSMAVRENIRRRYRVSGTIFVMAVMKTSTICTADADRERPSAPPNAVSSNQSLSVGGGPESLRTINEPAVEGGGTEGVIEALDPALPKTSSAVGRPLRSPRDAAVTRIAPPYPVPWYRTGPGALVIVLGLIAAGAWAMRRWMPNVRPAEGSLLRVVGRASLSPKHSAALIHVGRRYVLVGMSGDRVQLLSELADAEEVAELSVMAGVSRHRRSGEFEALLRQQSDDREEGDSTVAGAQSPVRSPYPVYQATRDLLHKLRAVRAT